MASKLGPGRPRVGPSTHSPERVCGKAPKCSPRLHPVGSAATSSPPSPWGPRRRADPGSRAHTLTPRTPGDEGEWPARWGSHFPPVRRGGPVPLANGTQQLGWCGEQGETWAGTTGVMQRSGGGGFTWGFTYD